MKIYNYLNQKFEKNEFIVNTKNENIKKKSEIYDKIIKKL